jgi:hypothetical protein
MRRVLFSTRRGVGLSWPTRCSPFGTMSPDPAELDHRSTAPMSEDSERMADYA